MTAPQHISLKTPFSLIACEQAFGNLEQKQALYAYYFAKASWNGSKICFFERSYESPAFLYIILKAFSGIEAQALRTKMEGKISDEDLSKIFIYVAAFLENAGNFKSFGDSKFVPECSKEVFVNFWKLAPYWSEHGEQFDQLWSKIENFIYEHQKPYALIQFSDKEGTTGYYSKNCTSEDAEKVKKVLIEKGIMSENNRLVKVSENEFVVKIASCIAKTEEFEQGGLKITLKYGQFSPFLQKVNKYLSQARKHSANEIQQKMIDQYIKHFSTGNMQSHKQSQRHWIKDLQPIIETNIGFIESYLDPLRVRAEFEGFVSIVNKKQSLLLTNLVDAAPEILKYLPWGSQFQVDVFKKPDFTSLEILAFASSGVPVGINIPNYDDIREHLGFKNVNLGNAYGTQTAESIQYCPQQQIQVNLKWHNASNFVIVALHELLGHGSGKLFHSKPDFPHPIHNNEFTTFYGESETWHSVFGEIASTYEECRADSVAIYLSLFEDVQKILLPEMTQEERWEIVFVGWFDIIVSGLRGLVYYDVDSKRWLQAHIGAAFAIFSVLREEGGIFEIKEIEKNGKPDLEIIMHRDQILTKGKKAMGVFLQKLQVYKSSADLKRGSQFFEKYLQVDEQLLAYRKIVELNKRPRKISIQPYVDLDENNKPRYHKYEPKVQHCIDSFVQQYKQDPQEIIQEWHKENQQFKY